MASLDDADPDVLDDVETYANHTINDIRDLQDRMRANAQRLGFHGAFLIEAAEMLDDVVHDALTPVLAIVNGAREFLPPSTLAADRADHHARLGVRCGG